MTTNDSKDQGREALSEAEIRKSMTSDHIQLERKLTCEAIDGAIAFGYQNTNPPPSDDHWLAPYWKTGRKQAELEAALATSASALARDEATGNREFHEAAVKLVRDMMDAWSDGRRLAECPAIGCRINALLTAATGGDAASVTSVADWEISSIANELWQLADQCGYEQFRDAVSTHLKKSYSDGWSDHQNGAASVTYGDQK